MVEIEFRVEGENIGRDRLFCFNWVMDVSISHGILYL
jgi:hypothetical protein